MKREKEFLIIRYMALFAISMQLILGYKENSLISVIFICLYIINNQLRLFYLKGAVNYISITLEFIISLIAYQLYSGNLIIYSIPAIIDCFIILKLKQSRIIIGIFGFISLCLIVNNNIYDGIVNVIYIAVLVIILKYLYCENQEKVTAQELYDKLRIKEIQLKEANKQLENYAASIEELTLLKERNRISREIHDSVGHALSTTMIQLSAMERISNKEESQLSSMIPLLREFVNDSLQDVRIAVKQLKPSEYEKYEGIFSIEELTKNFSKLTGVKVDFRVSKNIWHLTSNQVTSLYRIIQEALSNATRHGKASCIQLRMNFSDDGLVVILKDNGIGCSKIVESGLGLKGIRERVEELNGNVKFSGKDNGFSINIMLRKNSGGEV
ncbi:MAG: sensor histidine kinase [Clostridium sp.]